MLGLGMRTRNWSLRFKMARTAVPAIQDDSRRSTTLWIMRGAPFEGVAPNILVGLMRLLQIARGRRLAT